MSSNAEQPQFYNYPQAREGPSVAYHNEEQIIPVFRGTPLAIGAALIHSVGFIQNYFWRNAGFGVIRDIQHLDQYTARYDPTVIPALSSHAETETETQRTAASALPSPTEKRKGRLGYYTSADYHERYRSGELTPSAVVEALLPLIRRDVHPPGKHSIAFLESQVRTIRAAAEASTRRYKDGKPLGPLDGIPVAVKDEVHVKGYKRTLGSNLDFSGGCDGKTSWCVRKWEEAGAILIGKTTMHELGLDTNNNNPNYGTPRNPHNPNYYCGGSSGGSGYVVGAGLVPIALGADGGGSIRIPSSFCGIWGLKPSHSRVSGAPTISLAPTVGVYGPMAASVDDLALAYRVMAAPAPAEEDPVSALFPEPVATIPSSSTAARKLKNKTIGIFRDWIDRAEPSVRKVFDAAIDYYRNQLSYTVVDITIPYLPEGQRAHVLTIMAEIASGVSPSQIRDLSAPNKVLVSMGMHQIKAQDLIAAQRLRCLLMSHLAHLFKTYPGLIIVTPTTPVPGWKIAGESDLSRGLSDGKSSVRNMEYVWLANFSGCPAINCPAGYDDSRVPIGVMGMGEWGSEEDLIAFARDGEAILDLETAQPPVKTDEGGAATKGLKIPNGTDSVWVDVIAEAGKAPTDSA